MLFFSAGSVAKTQKLTMANRIEHTTTAHAAVEMMKENHRIDFLIVWVDVRDERVNWRIAVAALFSVYFPNFFI